MNLRLVTSQAGPAAVHSHALWILSPNRSDQNVFLGPLKALSVLREACLFPSSTSGHQGKQRGNGQVYLLLNSASSVFSSTHTLTSCSFLFLRLGSCGQEKRKRVASLLTRLLLPDVLSKFTFLFHLTSVFWFFRDPVPLLECS